MDRKGATNVVIIKVYREQGNIVALDVCGRADAGRGGAAVESAVAAIIHTLLMGLKSLRRIALDLAEEETAMHIGIRRGFRRSDVQALMRAAGLGLQQQSKQYPYQVRVVERIIYSDGVVL